MRVRELKYKEIVQVCENVLDSDLDYFTWLHLSDQDRESYIVNVALKGIERPFDYVV